jgi:hypothetical protein
MHDEVTIERLIGARLKRWKSSVTWEQPKQFKILFRNKLMAHVIQGILGIISFGAESSLFHFAV